MLFQRSVICCCLLISFAAKAQKQDDLLYIRISSAHTAFPDTARAGGHMYRNVLYDAAQHYSDSSVLIIIPKKLSPGKKPDMVYWFHGWYNHIDSANQRFALAAQFAASHSDAILILTETAKDAPDSYAGKLEKQGVFKALVNDVLKALQKAKLVSRKTGPGNIILAGHSGAYRVMAGILQNGGLPVAQVILFDALYGETEKYMNWINADSAHRFINIYTDGGGTLSETKAMTRLLVSQNTLADTLEEADLSPAIVQEKRVLIIHSRREHNEIINSPDNFKLLLQNCPFLRKWKY